MTTSEQKANGVIALRLERHEEGQDEMGAELKAVSQDVGRMAVSVAELRAEFAPIKQLYYAGVGIFAGAVIAGGLLADALLM